MIMISLLRYVLDPPETASTRTTTRRLYCPRQDYRSRWEWGSFERWMKDDIGLYPNLLEVKWKVKLGDVDVDVDEG